MASHASALKAHRQNIVRRERNRNMRTRLRGALRTIRTAIDAGDPAQMTEALRNTVSLVDKMAAKGVIHRNAASRYKARLASRVSKKTASAAA
ncbi:MAG: 30S ribosomal protein S20 [Acidobacteriota bacterium]|nr:30S ribosomal protein S20 [Acidobacteriota bacterium]MDQ3419115.1 30S ribosomal protein S20 [Acidobacteriota bacterium]